MQIINVSRNRADERMALLIQENDNLIQDSLIQANTIEILTLKLSEIGKKVSLADQQLQGTNDQIYDLQEHLDTSQEGKRGMERQLKFGHEELANKDAEIIHVNTILKKKQREIDALCEKNEELLGYIPA